MYYPVWELKEKSPHKEEVLEVRGCSYPTGHRISHSTEPCEEELPKQRNASLFFSCLSITNLRIRLEGVNFPREWKSIYPSIHLSTVQTAPILWSNNRILFFPEDLTLNWVCLCLEQSMSMVKNQRNLHIHHRFLARRFTYTKINARQNFFSHIHQSSTIVVPISPFHSESHERNLPVPPGLE